MTARLRSCRNGGARHSVRSMIPPSDERLNWPADTSSFVPHKYRNWPVQPAQKSKYTGPMEQSITVALENVSVLNQRIMELRSWIDKNPQESEVVASELAQRRCDAYWNCGYLAALEYASYLLFDETSSLSRSPRVGKESDAFRASTSASREISALDSASAKTDRPPIDRRNRVLDRRRGERRTAGLERNS